MDYIENNKAAWEEAFDHRRPNWGDDNYLKLHSKDYDFFNEGAKQELKKINLNGKAIAHFCCNNGRELLSLVSSSEASHGVGFDIAENILGQARETAKKAGISNCDFVNCNILEIPEGFNHQFDFVFFTIGAIVWFEDLTLLFEKVSMCLKENGLLFLSEKHPFEDMLLFPDEDGFDENHLDRVSYSYFRKEPWIENNGMGYMSVEYKSKTFTSFSHTMSDIINALSANGLKTIKLNEYDYDISGIDVYNGKGFPLSYNLTAEKC